MDHAGFEEFLCGLWASSGPQQILSLLDINNNQLTRKLADKFGFTSCFLPVRCFGLPLLPHKMRPVDYQPLIDKVSRHISSLLVRHLSFVWRLQLIQSVLFGIVNFWTTVFHLPKSSLVELERLCAFLWTGAPNSARGAKVSWDSVCTLKKFGELGLRRLEA